MNDPYEQLHKDAHRLRDDAVAAAAQAKDDARFYASYAAQTAKDKAREVKERAQAAGTYVDDYAREHTWLTAAMAMFIGLLIGVILGRDRRDR